MTSSSKQKFLKTHGLINNPQLETSMLTPYFLSFTSNDYLGCWGHTAENRAGFSFLVRQITSCMISDFKILVNSNYWPNGIFLIFYFARRGKYIWGAFKQSKLTISTKLKRFFPAL